MALPVPMYWVYIMTNKSNQVLYTGFCDDIERRAYDHRNKLLEGFTKRYNCIKLVYYEEFFDNKEALHRERQLKRYRRELKFNLIKLMNPDFKDLYEDFQ